MNRINLTKHVASIAAGLIVLFWTLYFMFNQLKYALGPLLFLVTFVVMEMLLSEKKEKLNLNDSNRPSSISKRISLEFLIVCVFVISLLVIFAVPSIKGVMFVDWSDLELLTILRMVAAFGMNFFPGYLILVILGKHRLGRLYTLITSYLLSVLVLSVTGFGSGIFRGILDEFFLHTFLILCSSLVLIYLVKNLLSRRHRTPETKDSAFFDSGTGRLPLFLLVLTIAFIGVWLSWMYSNIGFFMGTPGSDMWRSHSYAQTFLDLRAFTWLNLPWWFNLYLASYILISGGPSVNAFVTLYPLIAVSVISFYFMVTTLLRDRKIASIATLAYTIFSGPAWLYALYLRNFTTVTNYQAWSSIISDTGDKFFYQGWYPPFVSGFNAAVIAYTALWWIMSVTFRLNLRQKSNLILLSLIVALSYLLHGVEPLIFVIFLAAYLFYAFSIQSADRRKRVRLAAFSVIAALALVSVIDLSLTPQYESFLEFSKSFTPLPIAQGKYYYFGSLSFYALALSAVLLVVLTYIQPIENKLVQLYDSMLQRLRRRSASSIKRRLVEIFFYVYGITFFIWIIFLPQISSFASAGIGWIPWYAYPALGGVPFLLGLVGVALLVLRWKEVGLEVKEVLAFCVISIVLLFFFGQTVSFINDTFLYTGFWERRTLVYIQFLLSIMLAFGLINLFGRLHIEKPSLRNLLKIGGVAFLTSAILIGSVSSTLMAGDYGFRMFFSTGISEGELEALTYLHYSLPSGALAAYVNRYTGIYYIRALASDKFSLNPSLWVGQYSRSPSALLSAFSRSTAKYLYVNHERDAKDLKSNIFLQQLMTVLPVEFENSEVTIYSIPPLRLPSSFSEFGLVSQEENEGAIYDAYVLWFMALMMSGRPYTVISNVSNPASLPQVKTLITPYDPLLNEGGEQLLQWVSDGGHLVVSSTNPYGVFTELLGITSKTPLLNCDSTENWRTAYVPRRGVILTDNSTKVEGIASVRLQNNLTSWEEWVYTPSTPWNISGYDYFGMWIHGNGGGPIAYFRLTDSTGNMRSYRYDLSVFDTITRDFVPSFLGWKMLLIPISEAFGDLDVANVTEFRIVTGYQLSLDILIDDIFLVKTSGEGQTISADGIGAPININFPSVEVEGLYPSSGDIIANYTEGGAPVASFAVQREVGTGKVTILSTNALYGSILSDISGFPPTFEILTKILEMIGIQRPG